MTQTIFDPETLEEETADIFAEESEWLDSMGVGDWSDPEPNPYHDDDEGDPWPDDGDFFGLFLA